MSMEVTLKIVLTYCIIKIVVIVVTFVEIICHAACDKSELVVEKKFHHQNDLFWLKMLLLLLHYIEMSVGKIRFKLCSSCTN